MTKAYSIPEICEITGLSVGTIRKQIYDTHPTVSGKHGRFILYGQEFVEHLQANRSEEHTSELQSH